MFIDTARVRIMMGLTDTSYDTEIQNQITYTLPAIEYSIDPAALSDTGNTGLQSLLRLGAAEIISGELAAQVRRQIDYRYSIVINEMSIRPTPFSELDPTGLKAQGWARIRPYLRSEAHSLVASLVIGGGNKQGEKD